MQPDTRTESLESLYERCAQEYLAGLTIENHMEATPQATQRKITLCSFELVMAQRPDVHMFNELLLQYPRPNQRRPGQVCPDNMVVLYDGELTVEGSYDTPFQPIAPFWVLEYVSRSNMRKDYEDNMVKYESQVMVPYFLLFRPDIQEFILRRHVGNRYVTVTPDDEGLYHLPEIEIACRLHDGWVRFWFRGEMLPLPGDLLADLQETRQRLVEVTREAKNAKRRASNALRQRDDARRQADEDRRGRQAAEDELTRLRSQLAALNRSAEGK